jgi:beta-glucosidase-like glycosyl hydrolase
MVSTKQRVEDGASFLCSTWLGWLGGLIAPDYTGAAAPSRALRYHQLSTMRLAPSLLLALVGLAAAGAVGPLPRPLDRVATKWVAKTLAEMSLDEKVGQLIVSSFESEYLATDSDGFDALLARVRDTHVGGFVVFGSTQPAPPMLLDAGRAGITLGQPLAAASIVNRLQLASRTPLLIASDFETGLGFRLEGVTTFPRAMAIGAARDERLAYETGQITAAEARAIGVNVNFGPVADVNNNPRNPVINTRSFGEDPAAVAALASAYVKGLQDGGVAATLKHFPGHGDTSVDTHKGFATLTHDRERLDQIELVPFRAGIAAGALGVMAGHIELPALDPAPGAAATFSQPILTDLLRQQLGFEGLVFSDSFKMTPVAVLPADAAVKAINAGVDLIVDSPDDRAVFAAIKAAVERGEILQARLDRSVERILSAKARLDLHRGRLVDLDAVPSAVGSRAHRAVATELSERAITLLKDDRGQVPLAVARNAPVLYLSVLDYPSGWGIAAPSRTFVTELKLRWPNTTAVEISDRTPASEIELVRAMVPRFDAVVASVFVRAASGSGRMDLPPALASLLTRIAESTAASGRPFITTLFGNPYVAPMVSDLPAILLTYDLYDLPEASAVRAIAGETAVGGKLPITLPGLFPMGHGLERPVRSQGATSGR